MGNISGTRRISFNNDFAVGPALSIEKSLEDTNILMEIDNITTVRFFLALTWLTNLALFSC